MLDLMSYGLTGLTAVVVLAFCFAYGDESPLLERSIDLINKAHPLPFWRSGERNVSAIDSGTPNESVRGEVFHG